MSEFKVRILHISDLHERGSRERSEWRRRRVLGDAWTQNIETILTDRPIDFVCFTGDAADWGLTEEYNRVTEFFDATLKQMNLDFDNLLIVPGNHDINRKVRPKIWKSLRGYLPDLNPQDVSRWLSGERPAPRGAIAGHADIILERQNAYALWLKSINREALLPTNSPHGRLGYRSTFSVAKITI